MNAGSTRPPWLDRRLAPVFSPLIVVFSWLAGGVSALLPLLRARFASHRVFVLIYDGLQALLARGRNSDIPAEARRLFFLFVDELQTVDGASGGNLAALLEESRKFGGRQPCGEPR